MIFSSVVLVVCLLAIGNSEQILSHGATVNVRKVRSSNDQENGHLDVDHILTQDYASAPDSAVEGLADRIAGGVYVPILDDEEYSSNPPSTLMYPVISPDVLYQVFGPVSNRAPVDRPHFNNNESVYPEEPGSNQPKVIDSDTLAKIFGPVPVRTPEDKGPNSNMPVLPDKTSSNRSPAVIDYNILAKVFGPVPNSAMNNHRVPKSIKTSQTNAQRLDQTLNDQPLGFSQSSIRGKRSDDGSHEDSHHDMLGQRYLQWNRSLTRLRPPGGSVVSPVSAGGRPVSSFKTSDCTQARLDVHYHPKSPADEPMVTLGYIDAPSDNEERVTTEASEKQGNIVSIDEDWKPANNNTVKTDNERLAWKVSVFSKEHQPYLRTCGGSMVSRAAVISAARCFWREGEGLLPPSLFAVGAGEVLTYQRDDYDSFRQQNDVGAIKVPPTFSGTASNNRDNIAVVLLAQPFYDSQGMRPACVSFDRTLEEQQLRAGNIATTLSVGYIQKGALTKLQALRVPYIPAEECQLVLKESLQEWTEDKICAGFKSGTVPDRDRDICNRDSGAGLAFFLGDDQQLAKGIAVPFLRGVASHSHPCDAYIPTLYTRLSVHRRFLEEHLGGIVEECGKYYPQLGALLSKGYESAVECNCYC